MVHYIYIYKMLFFILIKILYFSSKKKEIIIFKYCIYYVFIKVKILMPLYKN